MVITNNGRRRPRRDDGLSLVEMAVYMAIVAPLFLGLAAMVTVFTTSATASHHRTETNAENQAILMKIAGELVQSSSKIDHALSGNYARPQSESFPSGEANDAYDHETAGGDHPMDLLHANLERDGVEAWHAASTQRRFYIYGTFTPFDTIEYQRVLSPKDGSNISLIASSVSQPWSPPRKIFLAQGTVYLRAQTADGETKTVVLGTHVSVLKFHLNVDGEIIIRLTTASGDIRQGSSRGATLTTQITVNPRNGLQ